MSPGTRTGKGVHVDYAPVSAGLVRRPEDWSGVVSTLMTLQRGKVQVERPKAWFKDKVPQSLTLSLTPPPCFADQGQYLSAVQALVGSRLKVLQEQWARQGRRVLGRRAVRKTAVTARPTTRKKRFGRSPTFSALTRQGWGQAVKRLRGFRAAYRRAYEAWRSGMLPGGHLVVGPLRERSGRNVVLVAPVNPL